MSTRPLPPIPERMAGLPVDHRGYPVPKFVEWIDGKPDFRVMRGAHFQACITFESCWICGQRLGRNRTFVIGPMCAINRTSAEPPSHLDCAEFAARACPFLTMPKAQRREAGLPEGIAPPAGVQLKRNPGVALLWTSRNSQPFRVENGVLFDVGDPLHVQWFAEGRAATRAEVLESIESGFPLLAETARSHGETAALNSARDRAMLLVPAEAA